jgi:hypothetical protein
MAAVGGTVGRAARLRGRHLDRGRTGDMREWRGETHEEDEATGNRTLIGPVAR